MSLIDESRIVLWARDTFPTSNPQSLILHMREEIEELAEAERNEHFRAGHGSEVLAEIGDLGLMLVHLADMYDATLADCIAVKFATARQRQYKFDASLGYARHVEERVSDDRTNQNRG